MTRREMVSIIGAGLLSGVSGAAHALSGARPRLRELVQSVREKHGLPALAAAVIVDGRVAEAAAVGVRKHGDAASVSVRDSFHLGSCTKAMTAVLIAQLVEQGKLDWETRLDALFPEMGESLHPQLRSVTVDHLLAHRAGLAAGLHPRPESLAALADAYRSPQTSRRQRSAFVEVVLRTRPDTEPGSTYAYSNAGYIVLGAIVERMLKEPWEVLMRRHIFRPLGMRTGGFGAMGRPGKVDQPWQHRMHGDQPVPVEPGILADNPPALGPAGTAHCSVGDWARFLVANVVGERERGHLLKPETWKRLHAPQFGGNYAGGWIITERPWGGRVLTHAGSNTMSFCVAWLAPDRGFGAGIMTNAAGGNVPLACDEAARCVVEAFALGAPRG